jgi:hypothetical protein
MSQAITFVNAKGDQVKLEQFLEVLNEKFLETDRKQLPALTQDGPYELLAADPGRKYIKVFVYNPKHPKSRSVYCFLDYQGNIYKAAGWRSPAKHVRGSVFDNNMSWGKSLGRYGAAYLR